MPAADGSGGTHSRTAVSGFAGLGAEHSHRRVFTFDGDHAEIFASRDNGATPAEMVFVALAGCLTAGVAAVATRRGVQLRSVTASIEGDMDVQGILGIDLDVRNGYQGMRVRYEIDADAPRGSGSDRGPVPEAIRRLRPRHQPDERRRRARLSSSTQQS